MSLAVARKSVRAQLTLVDRKAEAVQSFSASMVMRAFSLYKPAICRSSQAARSHWGGHCTPEYYCAAPTRCARITSRQQAPNKVWVAKAGNFRDGQKHLLCIVVLTLSHFSSGNAPFADARSLERGEIIHTAKPHASPCPLPTEVCPGYLQARYHSPLNRNATLNYTRTNHRHTSHTQPSVLSHRPADEHSTASSAQCQTSSPL